ncbi:MAG: outer membrane protein assembly factor BamD [Nitrospinae bacterium]|nr:outer membrane protein assembly factor BamD [Nitrospinota bacterium]
MTMRRMAAALGGLLFLAAGCATDPLIQPDSVTVNQANNFYARERFSQAIEVYRKAIDENPDSPYRRQALLGLADSLYKDGQFFEAVVYYERFGELYPLDPLTPRALFYMGMCHYQDALDPDRDQTNTDKAIHHFKVFLELYPSSKYSPFAKGFKEEMEARRIESRLEVAQFYFRLDKNVAAIRRIRDFLTLHPGAAQEAEAFFMLATCYYREEAFSKAAQVYTILLERYPDSPWAKEAIPYAEKLRIKKG